jgi:hypothetical protein
VEQKVGSAVNKSIYLAGAGVQPGRDGKAANRNRGKIGGAGEIQRERWRSRGASSVNWPKRRRAIRTVLALP